MTPDQLKQARRKLGLNLDQMARMTTYDQRLQMRLDAETAGKLDELRRRGADLPSRSELIRRLIHEACEAQLPSVSAMLRTSAPKAARRKPPAQKGRR